ncbi:MAG: DNA-3-methyladenine glycosylase [Oscillospiraceae bacterium]|nr:DNA-3-methyladenine glycosylase [Oscillospiraceae bacterium]
MSRLKYDFYHRPCLEVARDLVGKVLVHKTPAGELRLRISETEAYCGESDTACHAHKGRTKRTEVLYADAGTIYVYLCYGMHWLLNIVTGDAEDPQAVLIRACVDAPGPGRLTKPLGITGELNRGSILADTLWVEDDGLKCNVRTDKRMGIGYATPEDQNRPWRFIIEQITAG